MEEKDFDDQKNESGLLVKQDKYLEAGVHIGTKIKSGGMNKYIYRKRKDGLYVLDLKKIDERIRLAAKQLGRFEAEDILVVASRTYSGIAAANFCKITGTKLVAGRFIPGTLTNPRKNGFFEPEILLVCDPRGEKEALREAGNAGIPVIGLSDVDNSIKFIDWVVPCNNKGRRSLALIFYLLAREFLVSKGMIKSYDEFKYSIKDFSNDSSFKEIGNLDEQKEEEEKAKEEEIIKTAKQIDEAPLKKIEKAVKPKEEKPKEEIKIDRPKFIKQQKTSKKIREKTKEEQEESKPKTFKLEKPKENKKSETQKEPKENKTEEKE